MQLSRGESPSLNQRIAWPLPREVGSRQQPAPVGGREAAAGPTPTCARLTLGGGGQVLTQTKSAPFHTARGGSQTPPPLQEVWAAPGR